MDQIWWRGTMVSQGFLRNTSVFASCLMSMIGVARQAHAQPLDADAFARDRNISVRERPRPEYDPLGVPAGGFRLFPSLAIGIESDSNIFASSSAAQSDLIWSVDPSAELKSNWNTHALNLRANSQSRFYSDVSSENSTDWTLGTDGRFDIQRGAFLIGGFDFGDRHEARADAASIVALTKPVRYTLDNASLGLVYAFNRVRLTTQTTAAKFDYKDGRLKSGAVVEEDDRDRIVYETTVRGDYAISPATALFLEGIANWRDYRLAPIAGAIARDSKGYAVLVGANFEFTRLLRGEIGLGYLSQNYDDRRVSDSSGLAAHSKVEWFPDPLVTVTFSASRQVEDAGVDNAASFIATDGDIKVDYEYRRNLILGAEAGYTKEDYQGIDRNDGRWRVGAGVDYAVNRRVSATFQIDHTSQSSSGSVLGREYDDTRALFGIRLRR